MMLLLLIFLACLFEVLAATIFKMPLSGVRADLLTNQTNFGGNLPKLGYQVRERPRQKLRTGHGDSRMIEKAFVRSLPRVFWTTPRPITTRSALCSAAALRTTLAAGPAST